MWKDKNSKIEEAFVKDEETRSAQMQKLKELENENQNYK